MVFTVERILNDPTTPVRTFLKLVDKVEAVDDHTVKFTLNQPYSIFYRQISYINIMSKDYWDKAGDEGYATKPVGTGPYKFVEWVKDDRWSSRPTRTTGAAPRRSRQATFRPMPVGSRAR